MADVEHAIHSQVSISIKSTRVAMKTKIARAVVARLQQLPTLNYIAFDRVVNAHNEYNDTDIPALQIWDVSSTTVRQQARGRVAWILMAELTMKTVTYEVTQEELWNLTADIKAILFKYQTWSEIPGVIQMIDMQEGTDLHTFGPYYKSFFQFQVDFYDDIYDDCIP